MHEKRLEIFYIIPSRYDDDGYLYRFWKGLLPSNTLTCLRTLTNSLAAREDIKQEMDITVHAYDENVHFIPFRKIFRAARRKDTQVLVGLVGVQTNMFARATDLARTFREKAVQVVVGGFHVSGMLKMFPEPSRELQYLLGLGVSLFEGEVEDSDTLDTVLKDAASGTLKPLYQAPFSPDLDDAPIPVPDMDYLKRFITPMGTIDTSRGCPFDCSFCSVISVQGRKMRPRNAQAILETIHDNYARGLTKYFFTDDNMARSPIWKPLFDGLAALRQQGLDIRFTMQIDTQAWKIPHFIEKAAAAGCFQVFIGMESVNPENIEAVGKRQNKVDQFAAMINAWRQAGILSYVGYIIGFPNDTEESVARDVALLKDSIQVDQAAFFMLTPLPGSRDHRDMILNNVPLDEDFNHYDSLHETFQHEQMPTGKWRKAFQGAWDSFYGKENMVDLLLRTQKKNYWNLFWLLTWHRYATLLESHPMVMGIIRRKHRKDRRPTMPRESLPRFAFRRIRETFQHVKVVCRLFFDMQETWMLSRRQEDPRWATLMELRSRWTETRQTLMERCRTGRADLAAEEAKRYLATTMENLSTLMASLKGMHRRLHKKLLLKRQEIETYLQNIDVQWPSRKRLSEMEEFISEHILTSYENLAIRSVAKRRKFNEWRKQLIIKLKHGNVFTINWFFLGRVVAFELLVGLRFGITSLLHL